MPLRFYSYSYIKVVFIVSSREIHLDNSMNFHCLVESWATCHFIRQLLPFISKVIVRESWTIYTAFLRTFVSRCRSTFCLSPFHPFQLEKLCFTVIVWLTLYFVCYVMLSGRAHQYLLMWKMFSVVTTMTTTTKDSPLADPIVVDK